MANRQRLSVAVSILSLILAGPVAGAQAAPPAARWLPDGEVMVVQIEQPAALLDLAADLKIPEAIAAQFPADLTRLLKPIQDRAGTDLKGLVRKLAGGGVTYAMYPGDTYVVTLDAEDPGVLEPVQQLVQLMVRAQGANKGAFYKDFPGTASVWSLDGKQFYARAGNRLVVTNRGEMLKTLFAPRPPGGLASSPPYQQARKAAGEGAAVSAFVNMAMLNQAPPVRKALSLEGSAFDVVLDGAMKQALSNSKWIAMSLRVDKRSLLLHVAADGKMDPSGAGAFTAPPDNGHGILPNLTVPRELAAVSLWRDLGKFYSEKDTLFPEKTSGGILLENFMEIFFTGRDLNAEVFSRFDPAVRLVVARQEYDPAIGTPQEQYPAAALVFRVDHPEEFGEVMEEAWQKAVGLTNFTRGQQALPGLLIDKASHGGVPITYCYFPARSEKDRAHLPSRFNMRPALARTGPYIVLSTTDALAKDLIDAVNREDARRPAAAPSGAHTVLEVSGSADIAALLTSNRNELIRQSVVGSGAKPQAAEAQFDLNLALLKYLDRARLSFSATAEGQQADLELRLK